MIRAGKRTIKKKKIKSVAVIGAGFSGLVSSLLLSRSGIHVTLLERSEQVAPLLQNYYYQGFEVNNGFHYIGGYYPGGALYRSFEQLGINDKLKPLSFNDAGFDCFSGITNEEIVVPVGLERVRSVMERAFPESERVLNEYFKLMEEVFQEFSFFNLEEYFFKATPTLTGISLFEFLQERNAEDNLIDFLSIYSLMLLGVCAKEVPLLTHLLGIGAYFHSVHTFRGGGGALVEALEGQVRESGVQILTGSEVVMINCESRRRFSGLRVRSINDCQETTLCPDACISTIHPRRLLQLLPDGPTSNLYSRRISGCCDTRAVCVFHLAIDKNVARKYVSNYHIFSRKDSGNLGHQITLLPDFTSDADSSAAERRVSVMISAWENDMKKECPGRLNSLCYDAQDLPEDKYGQFEPEYFKDYRYDMVTRLEGAFPELKGKYRIINAVSPCHFDRLNATWNGAIYGVKCSLDRFGLSTIGPMNGLFLAGQSVTAPGIFGTLISAYMASNRIMRSNKL